MKYLKVNLWGNEIGRLVWDSNTRRTYFMYNPAIGATIPDIAPLCSPISCRNNMLPIYGDDRPIYNGLPPFIADSLPDSWGNMLFDKWVNDNKLPRNKVTPLYKLMFIGTRGMGALEYEPCASELNHLHTVDIKSLYDMSIKIVEDRDSVVINANNELTMQALLAVGTSAGGRQMKAIIAINNESGEIRSGQTSGIEGFTYYILKFGDKSMLIAEIETAYYLMAKDAGIEMEESRLFPIEGINHFLTKRFDRRGCEKIHTQTLAAINPDAKSYEDLIATCREIEISESEIEQVFLRMVFNIMANNTDDHNKNFSFLLKRDESWHLAPAYDMTYIFNVNGTGPNIEHRFSMGGKTSEITKVDILDFARQNGIKNAEFLIDRVAEAIRKFNEYAEQCFISQPWRYIIQKTLNEKLIAFGYVDTAVKSDEPVHDQYGRIIEDVSISVNSKGHYEVTAMIDGVQRKGFVRKNMNLYKELSKIDILNMSGLERIRLISELFPMK